MSVLTNRGIDFTEKLTQSTIQIDPVLRDRANAFLKTAQLPTTKDETWKYTRLGKLNKFNFNESLPISRPEKDIAIDPLAGRIMAVNGKITTNFKDLNVPSGITLTQLSTDTEPFKESKTDVDNELFSAINLTYLTDGIIIDIAPGKVIERPIELIHVLQGQESISNFKVIIRAGASSVSNFILGYFSDGNCDSSFLNNTLEIDLDKNARVHIDKVQYENESCFHITNELVDQEKDSTFTMNTVTLNGMLVRNNLTVRVNGENATSNLNGVYLLKGKQHVDNHTVVDHKVSHCNSNELYKGVIDEDATAVFNGKVYVRPDAQKINAFQSNGNILLSDNASINSKPELEIYADDVKCSHGSTTGQLDEEAVFYLRSRGISEAAAKKLLVIAFVEDVLKNIENERVHEFIETCLHERFGF